MPCPCVSPGKRPDDSLYSNEDSDAASEADDDDDDDDDDAHGAPHDEYAGTIPPNSFITFETLWCMDRCGCGGYG